MKFSAPAIISMLSASAIVSSLVLASADNRHLKYNKKGKGSKKQPEPPGPPQPQPQCETIELYYPYAYNQDCVKVANPFEGREQTALNSIGDTEYNAIYGPPDKDGFFTDPPIGIKFDSYQNGPAIPDQYEGEMSTGGWYKLAGGFMLDPTPTGDLAAPETLYRSSIWCQDYHYKYQDNYFDVNRLPIVGGSGKYACATGEIITIEPSDRECSYYVYRLRICNTCPDPEEEYE